MQMTQGWTRLRNVAIALGLFAWASTSAKADGILTYSTSGFVSGTSGVTGTNAITYESITNASVDTTSNLPLGAFQVAKLTGDINDHHYTNTPFSFTVLPSAYNGSPLSDFTPLTITGVLNGTLTRRLQVERDRHDQPDPQRHVPAWRMPPARWPGCPTSCCSCPPRPAARRRWKVRSPPSAPSILRLPCPSPARSRSS